MVKLDMERCPAGNGWLAELFCTLREGHSGPHQVQLSDRLVEWEGDLHVPGIHDPHPYRPEPDQQGDLSFLGGAELTPENDPTHPSGGAQLRPFPTAEETRRYIAATLDEPYMEPDPLSSHRVPAEVRRWSRDRKG